MKLFRIFRERREAWLAADQAEEEARALRAENAELRIKLYHATHALQRSPEIQKAWEDMIRTGTGVIHMKPGELNWVTHPTKPRS